jgi:hypothetical protein
VALDESVIACDMAHTPLEEASLGAVIFRCLVPVLELVW